MVASDRHSYTMTAAQFAAMGGQQPPEGYDPSARVETGMEGVVAKKDIKGVRQHEQRGTIYRSALNPTDPAPGFQHVDIEVIQDLALYFGVKPLSIHWPDKYSPDFTAVPLAQ